MEYSHIVLLLLDLIWNFDFVQVIDIVEQISAVGFFFIFVYCKYLVLSPFSEHQVFTLSIQRFLLHPVVVFA